MVRGTRINHACPVFFQHNLRSHFVNMKNPKCVIRISLLALSVLLFVTVAGDRLSRAQSPTTSPTPAPTVSPSPVASPAPTPSASPKVIGIEGHLELDDIVSVEVDHFADWAANNDATKLVPFINGRAIRGNYPEEIHPDAQRLHFHLEISAANKEVWTDLLGAPDGPTRSVTFSVGLENQSPFDSVYGQAHELPLTIINPIYGIISLLVVGFTLFLFLWLARRTNIIREPGADPGAGKQRPYNLGRTQMAFWFFLIYVSYISIWLITNALDTITASLLALMGISAGTALSEALIDSGKDTAQGGQFRNLTGERQSLEQAITDLQSQLAAAQAKETAVPDEIASLNKQLQDNRTQLAQINQRMSSMSSPADANVSRGFLQDILGDASGYSFHRFQIFAWTIVLGIIFISSVYNSLSMPQFSATLLGLMGLSSGTYLGFKFPEQRQ